MSLHHFQPKTPKKKKKNPKGNKNDNWRNFNIESLVRHLNPSVGGKIENSINIQLPICYIL